MSGDLYLTNGTIRINLRNGIDGWYLDQWDPAIAGRKSTWRDSPLSDGRKPALRRWSNATETMKFKIGRPTQDDVIYETQELRRLLLAAEEYFIGGSDTPVWLEARGTCETNTRYAVIVTWGTGNDSDPYHKPFDLDNPVMSPWTLTLERQHWRHMAPGTSECVELSATQDYYQEQIDDWVPTESGDDCYADVVAGSITLNGNLRFGRTAASAAIYGAGIRFRSVTIPKDAYIIRAWIDWEADANLAANDVKVTICCGDEDSAVIFTNYASYAARARTTAETDWTMPAYVAGTIYSTPDFASSVQEVVNRALWVSGNHLVVLFDENTGTAGATRTAEAWDAADTIPTLYVHWFDSHTQTFGRTATCNDEVYIANKHNRAQLTHIFIADGAVFSGNLLTAALPYDLFPAAPAVGDDVYFGISTAAPDSGPFCSLVFDISIIQVSITTVGWFYYNGIVVALTVRDNTNANGAMTRDAFDTLGVNSVHWVPPADWIPQTVNGVTGYWVKATAQVVGGGAVPPRQANRHPYTVVTPYLDTTAANVLGDIQALAKMELEGESGDATVTLAQGHILAGLRSYDRGADFTSFLNLADEQNPTGITVTVNGGTATFADDITSPTGRVIDWTTGALAAEAWLAYITIPLALVDDFAGEFRSLMRVFVNSATASNLLFRLRLCMGGYTNVVRFTEQFSPVTVSLFDIIDFKKIIMPPMLTDTGDTFKNVILRIDGQALAAVHAHLIDLINIPTDECFFEARQLPIAGTKTYTETYPELEYRSPEWKLLDLDSTIPRRMIRADTESTTGYKIASWQVNANVPVIWQPNEHQRWWFFQNHPYALYGSKPYDVLSAQAWEVSRYLSMRGKR